MKRLILMRHAKAGWTSDGGDHERILNRRGRAGAAAMGGWLKERRWRPDEVLCSTATRTRQTLELLDLPETPTRFDRRLYLADPEDMIALIRTAEARTVLVVGHNHGIAICAHMLVQRAPDHARFDDYPTGATTLLEFDIGHWPAMRHGTGTCAGFAIPKDVIGAGGPG